MKRSTIQHLRIPFSFFLLPVYLFALSLSYTVNLENAILVAIALHIFLYPASNGYNSYFDRDKGSIGGVKKPLQVTELYWVALIFDAIALLIGLWIDVYFAMMLLIYGLVSKAYSHPSIRLKNRPYLGWLIAGLFQGYFTFLMSFMAINELDPTALWHLPIQLPALLSSALLWGSYPMTQVYQHEEDKERGDITISLKLGILGTFHFTAVTFGLANIGFILFYGNYYGWISSLGFQSALLPVLILSLIHI